MSGRRNSQPSSSSSERSQPKKGVAQNQKGNQEQTSSTIQLQNLIVQETLPTEVMSLNVAEDDTSSLGERSDEVEEVNEEVSIVKARPPDFSNLSGGKIYELLNNLDQRSPPWIVHFNGKKLGHIFNRILSVLFENKMVATEAAAKTKKQWNEQKIEFEEVSEKGLTLMRELIKTEMLTSNVTKKVPGLTKKETPVIASLFCRIAHMVMDPDAQQILSEIHAGAAVLREEERVVMDDTSCRMVSKWNELCMDYFNNSNFKPTNCISQSLIEVKPELGCINPSLPPEKPWDSNRLKTEYNNLRNKYTRLHCNFHKSGQNVEDSDHIAGDVEFMEKYCEGDLVYAYLHVVFDRAPPKFILREMPEKSKFEVGIKKSPDSAQSNAKRKRLDNPDNIHVINNLSDREFELEAKRVRYAIERDEAITREAKRISLDNAKRSIMDDMEKMRALIKSGDLTEEEKESYSIALKEFTTRYLSLAREHLNSVTSMH